MNRNYEEMGASKASLVNDPISCEYDGNAVMKVYRDNSNAGFGGIFLREEQAHTYTLEIKATKKV